MSSAHHIPADDSAEGTKFFFMGGSDKHQLNRISSNGALTPGLTAQGVPSANFAVFFHNSFFSISAVEIILNGATQSVVGKGRDEQRVHF